MLHSLWKLAPSFRYAFRPQKPLLLFRLAKALILARVFKKQRLRYVDFSLNLACNMKCEHCFATALEPDKSEKKNQMTLADYKRIAEEAMELGAVNFSFQGGEPLLLKNIDDYIEAVSPAKNIISVTTNGTLLNREKVRHLKKVGVDILTISLDSYFASEHDKFRNFPGAHQKAMEAITIAREEGLNVTIGATVSRQNLRSEGIACLIEFAEANRIILCFNLATPAGNWSGCDNILLAEDDINLIHKWEKEHLYVRTDFEANLCQPGCGAVKEILYLTPYGDMLACPFIHTSLGNVLKESLEDIRNRALTVPDFAIYAPKCLCAEDKEFMDKYIRPASKVGLADGFEAFGWTKPDSYRS